jgi:SAM-dependent methyltransferase
VSARKPEEESPSEGSRSVGVFDGYARFYDLLYADKDYAAEAGYVAGLIRRHAPDARALLELGSGTGRHAALLVERGYRVHGVERSAGMLARSRAVAERVNAPAAAPCLVFTEGDIRTVRLGCRFDVVLSLFHVISYQTTNSDVLAAMATARRHLDPGGLFIFDVWYGPAVLVQRPATRVKRVSDPHWDVTRIAEPALHCNRNTVSVAYRLLARSTDDHRTEETEETHLMRYFFLPEIELLAEGSGFELVRTEAWLTGAPPDLESWSASIILKAT